MKPDKKGKRCGISLLSLSKAGCYCHKAFLAVKMLYNVAIMQMRIFLFIRKSKYLENGEYNIWWSEKPIVYKEAALDFVNKFELKAEGINKAALNIKIYVSGNDKKFYGQAAMLTVSKRYKIFDLKKGQVMSVLDNAAREQIRNVYNKFDKKIKTVYIGDTSDGIIEKIIDFIPVSIWTDNLIKANYLQVLSDQLYYIKNTTSNVSKSIESILEEIYSYDSVEINEMSKRIFEYIKGKYSIPCIFSHCDIHFDNILYDGKQLYYTDVEYARNEIFFYDIFNCFFVEFLKGKSFLLEFYIKKDKQVFSFFSQIFAVFSLELNDGNYMDFLYIFLLARLNFDCSKRKSNYSGLGLKRQYRLLKLSFQKMCNYLDEYT